MQEYNPFILDMDKDKPSFSNDKCDFWLIQKGKKCVILKSRDKKDKSSSYLIADKKTGEIIYHTNLLEAVCVRLELIEKTGFF